MRLRYYTILLALLDNTARAEFHLLDVDSMTVSVAKFQYNRDPMTPQYDGSYYVGRVSTQFNLRMLEVLYWNNDVHTEAVPAHVETVGWHFETGVHLTKEIDIFWEHHSQHVMDGIEPQVYNPATDRLDQERFPVEDSYGIRLHFYINPNPHSNLFGDN